MTAATQKKAIDFFVSQGWSLAQSCGIVANLIAESNLNPDATGDGGAAFGLAQWHGDRQTNFASVLGKDIHGSSLEDQCYFVHAELRGTEKRAGDALAACMTAGEAGACVSKLYERPADTEGDAAKRATLAESIFAEYSGTSAGELSATRKPIEAPAQPAAQPTTTGGHMGPLALLQMFGPLIMGMIPQVKNIVQPPPDSNASRNLDLAQVLINTLISASGAAGQAPPPTGPIAATPTVDQQQMAQLAAAVTAMQADMSLQKKVRDAVLTQPQIAGLLEVGGGAAAAREQDIKQQQQEQPFYKTSAVFWVSILLVPMVYWYVGSSVVGGVQIPDTWPVWAQMPFKFFGTVWDPGARVGLANLIVGLVLGGICGVYYGISVTQQKQQNTPPGKTA